MTINFKQNWVTLAWTWAVAVVVWFIVIKLLASIVGTFFITDGLMIKAPAWEAGVLNFLRSDVFLGLAPSLFLGLYLLKKGQKNELGQAMVFSGIGVCFVVFLSLLSRHWTDVVGSLFYMECAPLWALAVNVFLVRESKTIRYVSAGQYQRGVRQAAVDSVPRVFELMTQKETPEGIKAGIPIWAGCPFPFKRENQHFLVVGSPGAGKTQMIYPMLWEVLQRGDEAIVWDIKGTFIQAFAGYERVDLLAAWDERSIAWSPGADIKSHLDCQQVASIMLPPNPKDSQPFFLNSARNILESIFIYLDSRGSDWGWGDVWAIISLDRKEMATLLSSFEDGKALANTISGDSKSAEDIYSTLISHAQQTIRWYAKAWPKGNVSLRKWVHGDQKLLILGGIPERADLAQATANIAVELIVNEILSLPDDPNRRVWLFLDELATLGKLTSLLNAFSLGRSKGLCVVAGIQDVGKLAHHYGQDLVKSITNTFSTLVVLRCSDYETAQWASHALGEQEVLITTKSSGSSSGDDGKTSSSSGEQEQLKTMPLFMPSQISNLENQGGVIRVSGWPLLHVQWNYSPIPQDQPLTVEADWIRQKDKPVVRQPQDLSGDFAPKPSEAAVPKADSIQKSTQASASPTSSWRVDE